MKKPWTGLVDLIEDTRHQAILLRKWLTRDEYEKMSGALRPFVDASNRAASSFADKMDNDDKNEIATANYLIGQYEEALTFLGSMSIQ